MIEQDQVTISQLGLLVGQAVAVLEVVELAVARVRREHESQAQLLFRRHFPTGCQLCQNVDVPDIGCQRSDIGGEERLARFGAEQFVVPAKLDRKKTMPPITAKLTINVSQPGPARIRRERAGLALKS